MRDILFRGKVICTGDWVCGDFAHHKDGWVFIRLWTENVEKKYISYEVKPETVGQYTGLKDINGTRIFEGDIVQFEDAVADCEGYHDNVFLNRSEIFYSEGSFSVRGTQVVRIEDLVYGNKFGGIVIGNIHDNPELLEG